MDNGELLKFNLSNNEFELFKNDEIGNITHNLLNLLVASEDSEKESEKFDYFKNIFQHSEFIYRESKPKSEKSLTESEIIRQLYDRISKNYDKENEDQYDNHPQTDFSSFKIDYPKIISLNFRLVSIIKNFIDKKQKEFDLNVNNMLERNIKQLKFLKISQINFLQDLETIKTIEIKLSNKKHDSIVNIDYILFFCIFFNFLFPYVLEINLNMNCEKIDRFFFSERNPFKVSDKLAMKIAKKYEKILIANLIVSKLLTRHDNIINLILNTSDCYVLELNEFTANEFIFKNKNKNGFHEYSLMKFSYLDSFFNLNNLLRLECNFNSLDSVLFQKINLILVKNISIVSLSLNLFPKDMKFNIRKFYLNDKFYFDRKEENIYNMTTPDDDLLCDFPSMSNNLSSSTYTHGKILKILFNRYNENLNNLIVILNSKITKLKYLKINLSPYSFLNNYDFYTASIACFILNIFKVLSNHSNKTSIDLIEFELNSSKLNFDFSKFQNFQLDFNLNKIKIDDLILNLNIWNVINFDQLPNEYLNSLTLNQISTEDFTKFQKFLYSKLVKENENILNNLIYLNISVSLKLFQLQEDESNFFDSLCEIFNYKLPNNLQEFSLMIKNKINLNTLMTILHNIKKFSNSNLKKIKLQVNLSLENYYKFSHGYHENFLEDTKIISNSHIYIIQIDIYKIKQILLHSLYRMLFVFKKAKRFSQKFNDEVIIMNLTKFLFTNKSKRVEVFIENKLNSVFIDY